MQKNILISFFPIVCVLLSSTSLHAQSLTLKGNLSYSTIGEVETSFIHPGLSIEGRAGSHWSFGADIGFGSNSTFDLFQFSPAVKYYFGQSLRSFYLGAAVDAYRLKRKNGGPIGYPFENDNEEFGIAAGLQVLLGAQTIIHNLFVLGIQLGPGYMPGIDAGFLRGTFYAGISF